MITQILNYRKAAKDKLEKEYKDFKGGRYEEAMKRDVLAALLIFVSQDNEFAQAVAEGGSFADCMKAVAKSVATSISDIDAYKKAVRFYFPGADISFTMTVKVNPYEQSEADQTEEKEPEAVPAKKKSSALSLSLDDLF